MRSGIALGLAWLAPALAALCLASPAHAVSTTYNVFLDGSQEVGGGDPTGTGMGTITLDPNADIISWQIDYQDLDDPFPTIYPIHLSGWHIHGPGGPAGTNASILVDLDQLDAALPSGIDSVPFGTLIGMVGADSAAIDAILGNPSDFYLNLHTSDNFGGAFGGFPAGAIRGQIAPGDPCATRGGDTDGDLICDDDDPCIFFPLSNPLDSNLDGIPDECQCGDISPVDGDGLLGFDDATTFALCFISGGTTPLANCTQVPLGKGDTQNDGLWGFDDSTNVVQTFIGAVPTWSLTCAARPEGTPPPTAEHVLCGVADQGPNGPSITPPLATDRARSLWGLSSRPKWPEHALCD